MIQHYPYSQLGGADHGWLKTRHHFSFAHYYNPARMGFGKLRVINDDWIAPGTGFPAHPHNNMEIISFIRTGAVTHLDSEGNKGVTETGEMQVMSAGTGITHSEYNKSQEPLTLYQIWIETNKQNVKPRWDSKDFPTTPTSALTLLASGYDEDKDNALFINQQARIYGGNLTQGTVIEHNIQNQAYILASKGTFTIEDSSTLVTLNKGDGAEVSQEKSLNIVAIEQCEIIIIDVVN